MICRFLIFASLTVLPMELVAQETSHCNALLQHGINNITRYQSAEHAIAYKYHQNCGSDFDSMSDSRVRAAAVSVFGYGSGQASGNSSQMRTALRKWCDTNQDFAASRTQLFQEASTLNSSALTAWNQCQDIAKKAVNISFQALGDHSNYVHIEVDSTLDANLVFFGVDTDGYTCETKLVDPAGNVTTNAVNQRIGNSNIQIDCQRDAPVTTEENGVGKIEFKQGYIVVNTSGSALPIAFEQVVDTYYVTPPGAIMAFNQAYCPEGWTPFKEGAGRFIVGASDEISFASQGGRADIPDEAAHNHTGRTNGMDDLGQPHPHGHDRHSDNNRNHNHAFSTSTVAAHNHGGDNMPPYVAMTLCQR
ncbi:hypothetical protein PsW64_04117 [Pseudovibrio sp. W64]|uniref:hypothetical protein n=1 Tax=Pseudovibrio sp. W64 TaxID=1735583 RepID=UPI0007AE8FBF|nr:hypothetical protein [Pseudovibrio sp. W64]KZK78478.1 hypothetical protein PsW64_04117 [Pseudovibrio sp. W64]